MKKLWNGLSFERKLDVKASLFIIGILALGAGATLIIGSIVGIA